MEPGAVGALLSLLAVGILYLIYLFFRSISFTSKALRQDLGNRLQVKKNQVTATLWAEELKDQKEKEEKRRFDAIENARIETENLVLRGAIFEVSTSSRIRGYHTKELGWVRYECNERSVAESNLRSIAAKKFDAANVLTKLSQSLREERNEAGTGPRGNPFYRTEKIVCWEAMACEAIEGQYVDKSPVRWNKQLAVVDGSNVAYWGGKGIAELAAVNAVLRLLRREGIEPTVVFDANIGFKIANKPLTVEELKHNLLGNTEIIVVPSGVVADRKIIEIAEQKKAVILSNDLFRDSLRARPIPKRRGFFLSEYDYAEVLDPRPAPFL